MLVANKKKTPTTLLLSGGLLVITIIATVGIYFYNSGIVKDNLLLQGKIDELQSNINELKKDPQIQIASLISMNKGMLEQMEYFSQIPTFFSQINEISDKFSIDFESFKYADGIITMKASAEGGEGSESYKKIVDFISDYRKNSNSGTRNFDLGFIRSFENDGDIKFQVDFKVKPKTKKKITTTSKQESIDSGSDKTPKSKAIILEKLKQKSEKNKVKN